MSKKKKKKHLQTLEKWSNRQASLDGTSPP